MSDFLGITAFFYSQILSSVRKKSWKVKNTLEELDFRYHFEVYNQEMTS